MTTAPELKSCPFCGVALVFDASMGADGRWFHPHSGEDKADPGEVSCILSAYMVRNRPTSIARWNRRDLATALSEATAENERLTRERDAFFDSLRQLICINSVLTALRSTAPLWLEHAERLIDERNALNPKGGDNGEA